MSDSTMLMTRRHFALTTASALGPLSLLAAGDDAANMPWAGPATVRKVYLGGRPVWPRPDADLSQDVAGIEARLGELERRYPGQIRFTGGEMLKSDAEVIRMARKGRRRRCDPGLPDGHHHAADVAEAGRVRQADRAVLRALPGPRLDARRGVHAEGREDRADRIERLRGPGPLHPAVPHHPSPAAQQGAAGFAAHRPPQDGGLYAAVRRGVRVSLLPGPQGHLRRRRAWSRAANSPTSSSRPPLAWSSRRATRSSIRCACISR